MHMCIHDYHMMGDRNQQNKQSLGLFLLKYDFILVSNSIHQYNIFQMASFFQMG